MDPRLQPRPAAQGPRPMQDVQPAKPVAAPAPVPPVAIPNPIQTPPPPAGYEVVASIPMAAQPGQTQPAISAPMPNAAAAHESDDELDKILQAVNNRVQAPTAPPKKAAAKVLSKVAAKASKVKKPGTSAKPFGAMAAVIVVFLALSATAVMAYRQNSKAATLSNQPGKVGTSSDAAAAIQSAGGTLVRPADLDDYSQTLANQLNTLNDKGDFDSNSLSDAVLGL